MYKRYSLEITPFKAVVSGTYVRPKVYQIMDYMCAPASMSLYLTIPDHCAAIMIYAPPASGKSTFMRKLHERFCSCTVNTFTPNIQFVSHEYHIIDTDHSIFERNNIVITNVYHLMCRADKTIAILPSAGKMASRYDLRGLQLRDGEYDEIETLCKRATFFIRSDDYVDNLLRFTEL